ncbi:DUF997 family protein [Aeromonas diversa]|uniref:Uncharacterized protein n=1 Tax=Aeromonas diversa CDC 2478-85 TaxID=1268237 RepID=N9VBR7_9GAMM|nr:DUF997 family protein [Aeromonas diversa]ENY72657.1 hypothetical protein G114_06947 [Aeromonas diversa CDC 2478-85]
MNRFILARREALLCLGLALLYFIAWYASAYAVPEAIALWGIPLWFLLSCMVMPLLFIALCAFMVERLFVEVDLNDTEPGDES